MGAVVAGAIVRDDDSRFHGMADRNTIEHCSLSGNSEAYPFRLQPCLNKGMFPRLLSRINAPKNSGMRSTWYAVARISYGN